MGTVKYMRTMPLLMCLGLYVVGFTGISTADTNLTAVPTVAITNLLAHKDDDKSKRVVVTGYYSGSFEHYVLYETEANRDPDNSLWIDIFFESPSYKQQVSHGNPADFRGKVRIVGTFEYRPGQRCGHMGVSGNDHQNGIL